jgi:hypothetical protein
MAMNQLKITGINPWLSVLGDTQRLNYSVDTAFFSVKSSFQPTQYVASKLALELRNCYDSGFRLTQETNINGGMGQLKFQSFLNSSFTGTDLLTLDDNGVVFNLPASFPPPVTPTDAANKQYVDSKTWLTSQITNFDATLRSYRLSDFLASVSNLSLSNFNLMDLANPINAQDAVTKFYADNMQKTVAFSGAVSGSGLTGSAISTTFNLRLDQIPLPTASVNFNSQKIINLATPTLSTDAVTKAYVDSSVGGVSTSITLQGDISGTGSTGSAITTTFNKRLDQITPPTTSLNLNSQQIVNLAAPTLSTDASTKAYVDGKTWTASQITDFDPQVRLSRLDQMSTPTASVNFNSQKITNLATPTLSTDAASKSYVDSAVSGISTNLTLQGAISGSGSTSSAIATTLNTRLDQVPLPTQTVNLNNQKITNLSTPTFTTDAVNKSYADTSTVSPSRLTGYPSSSTSFLRGDGIWAAVGGGGGGDTFQTLTSATNVAWNWDNGNVAVLTLTGNCTITPTMTNATRGTLIVKQDSTGGRTLMLPAGIYRQGTTAGQLSLTGTPNSIDVLQFFRDGSGNIYIWNSATQFIAVGTAPTNKYVFIFDSAIKTLTIPVSANNVCRIKVLGAGGGQGVYSSGGSSGAGGYTIFQFNTTSYIGQEIKLLVGGGGEGGSRGTQTTYRPGKGGYPNGGWGISGDTYPGGGGGRSDVRIGANTIPFSAATMVAIAGGGGGGTGFSGYGGAGGGTTGQQSQNPNSSPGTQTAGGISAQNPPVPFTQAGFLQGAGSNNGYLTDQGYDTGGGGDGYYGGGCSGGDGQASSGGSGYINTSFSGYLSSYGGYTSGTFQGNQIAIPTQASSDSDFQDGSGSGRVGIGGAVVGMNGGNGKIVVEFL